MRKVNDIKFRVFHKRFGIGKVVSLSFYGEESPFKDTECLAYYPNKKDTLLTSYDEVELMQYTGVKDKNGVHIYEGDILEGVHHELTYHTSHKEKIKGEVYYTNRGTWDCDSFLLGDLNETCEVIGNIYNN